MLKRLSGIGFREQGILSIVIYEKEQYRHDRYAGKYLITYPDYVVGWEDNEEWLERTIKYAKEINNEQMSNNYEEVLIDWGDEK